MATRQPTRRNLLMGLAAAVVLMIVAVLMAGRGDESTETGGSVGAEAFAHVHGLGVNPADGHLYVGTHYGVFRITADGRTTQVGPTRDYMGFTVVGPDRFYASGHPSPTEGGPSALGLIESINGGRDWRTLSLAGEADFHALHARHDQVYGHNAGALMVSSDTKQWETRSRLTLRDLAVSPVEPDTMLATTPQGLMASSDGGRSWRPLPTPVPPVLVTWPDGGNVYSLSADGAVRASADGGATWEKRGRIAGMPQAMTATATELYIAADSAIHRSSDGGRTFAPMLAQPE